MIVERLKIKNFKGIKDACLHFTGHTLLVGANNVGKSTICEALDLVLSPERLQRSTPVEEFDFYNAKYLEEDNETAIHIEIEVVLTKLSEDVERICSNHLEFWHVGEKRLLAPGEIELADTEISEKCLRLVTIAKYDPEEDEFEGHTFFAHSPDAPENELTKVPRTVKRLFGFLYLRTLRTGSRALSLEKGSLLDIVLRLKQVRTGIWEQSIRRLENLDPSIDHDALDLQPVLQSIEQRLSKYISTQPNSTKLYVSKLTREHLRSTLSFFLSITDDQKPVPFQEVGTGTLNVLVLALLSFIAELKTDVIFAMEEPEIALPPHTQRRIAQYLIENTTQCFVTSHSPYVVEQFEPEQIRVLRRSGEAEVKASIPKVGATLKVKMYKRHVKRSLSEAMLGNGVIIAEGVTEKDCILAVARKLEENDPFITPLDLLGISIVGVDGDGSLVEFAEFFKDLGLKTFGLYDQKERTTQETARLVSAFDIPGETNYPGIEKLLSEEIPIPRLWAFLDAIRGVDPGFQIPAARPSDDEVKAKIVSVLRKRKGEGYAGDLIDSCTVDELPNTLKTLLEGIYGSFAQEGDTVNTPDEAVSEDSADNSSPDVLEEVVI